MSDDRRDDDAYRPYPGGQAAPRYGEQARFGEQPRYGEESRYGEQSQYGERPRYGEQSRYGGPGPQAPGPNFYGNGAYDGRVEDQPGYTPAYAGGYEQGYGYGPGPHGGGRPSSTLAITSLVCGILGIFGGLIVIGGLLGLAAVVLGIIVLVLARSGRAGGRGLAIAGIVTGVVSLLVSLMMATFIWSVSHSQDLRQCSTIEDPAAQQQCLDDWAEKHA